MRTKVEILRAIEYTKEDLSNISNLGDLDEFTEKDKEFMESFKMIYELGLNQLETFINKLDEEGKDLDVYSIKYYVNLLLNGPLGNFARELGKNTKNKNYFVNAPDCLGLMGNKLRSIANTTVLEGYPVSLGCPVDLFNKSPKFIQDGIEKATKQTETMFRSNILASVVNDNTLPIVDKANQNRYNSEPTGEWALFSNGNYLLKDSYFYQVLDDIQIEIFDLIKFFLGEENFRLFRDNKEYNSFGDKNDSISKNWIVNTRITENNKTEELELDIYGTVVDSEERRDNTIKINTVDSNKEYNLGTLEGQLGI